MPAYRKLIHGILDTREAIVDVTYETLDILTTYDGLYHKRLNFFCDLHYETIRMLPDVETIYIHGCMHPTWNHELLVEDVHCKTLDAILSLPSIKTFVGYIMYETLNTLEDQAKAKVTHIHIHTLNEDDTLPHTVTHVKMEYTLASHLMCNRPQQLSALLANVTHVWLYPLENTATDPRVLQLLTLVPHVEYFDNMPLITSNIGVACPISANVTINKHVTHVNIGHRVLPTKSQTRSTKKKQSLKECLQISDDMHIFATVYSPFTRPTVNSVLAYFETISTMFMYELICMPSEADVTKQSVKDMFGTNAYPVNVRRLERSVKT